MPLVNYNPWADAASFGQGLGHSLGQALIAAPAMRSQIQLQGAQTEQALAHGAYYRSRAQHEGQIDDDTQDGLQGLGDVLKAMQARETPNPEAVRRMGKAFYKNPEKAAEFLVTAASLQGADPAHNPNVAAGILGYKPPTAGANEIVYPAFGNALYGPTTANAGQTVVAPGASQPSVRGAINLGAGDTLVPATVGGAAQQLGPTSRVSPSHGGEFNLSSSVGSYIAHNSGASAQEAGKFGQDLKSIIDTPIPKRIYSQEEYDALPPGAHYTDSSGRHKVKRGGEIQPNSDQEATPFLPIK